MGNEGAQFGAGAQEDSMSCQIFHTLEQMQDLQKAQGEHFKPLKSDMERERCGLMPFNLMHKRKTANGFFWRRQCAWFIHQPFMLCLTCKGRMGMCQEPKKQGWAFFSTKWTTFINSNLNSTIKSSASCEGQHLTGFILFPLVFQQAEIKITLRFHTGFPSSF